MISMKLIALLYKLILSLRYKIHIKGTEVLKGDSPKFVLPNHQALVDPQILFAVMSKYIQVVPLVTERFAKAPIFRHIFKSMGAITVSDLSAGSRDTNILNTISVKISDALKDGKHVLLYPSGQTASQGYEKIYNKLGAWTVVNSMTENTRVIGVRIHGLWGSMWSRAWKGDVPIFIPTYLKGVFIVLANLIFFIPRRKVTVEFYDITSEAVSKAKVDKTAFNTYLEEFYNVAGEEQVNYIKHYFFVPKLKRNPPERIVGSVEDIQNIDYSERPAIPKGVFQKVAAIIAEEAKLNEKDIKLNSNINLELNIDSITLVSIITAIEQKFSVVASVEVTDIKSVEDLCALAAGLGANVEKLKPCNLHIQTAPIIKIEIDKSLNIADAFLKIYSKDKKGTFLYDKMLGTSTRKDFLLKAFVVSKIIRKEVKGTHVGIMLPALQSTTLLVLSTYLAGKIPVMLNWTVGKKVLEYCIETAKVEQILTAKTFYDKIEPLLPDSAKSKCIFFEQKVKAVSTITKLSGLINYFTKITPNIKPDDVAVILFTSGSESLPKAVPLTHHNIMYDLWGVFETVSINTDRVFLAFLPPFHSFGFTVLTILPLISLAKAAYTPDPTDKREVIKILKHTKSNTLVGTPTFLKMILSASNQNDLKNVDLVITGAESLHPSLINTFYEKANANAKILEGYGITECSPVLTINPTEKQKLKSVGLFIKCVDYLITDINTYSPLEQGREGMIFVTGANIFKGYTDKNIESPFVTVNNIQYYKTGDLGYVDEEGYLFITGRLKRFIKIAGEMISLPAIENTLLKKYGSDEKVVLAIEGKDNIAIPVITLFTILDIDINEANAYLKQEGFSNLVKINKIIKIEEVPLLGTGKTDYKVLKNMI